MENRQTLKHIAEKSGMSLSSVSRTLDPARSHLVRPTTRKKILKCAEDINFTVNLSARRLRRNQTEVITVVVYQNSFKPRMFSTEFISPSTGRDNIQRLSMAIKSRNYDMKLEFLPEGQRLPDTIFDRNRTDGIIFVNYYGTAYIDILEKTRLPNIYMSNFIDTTRTDVALVGLDREPGYRQALEHQINSDGKSFAWVTPPAQFASDINTKVINKLFREYGIYNEAIFFDNVRSYYDIQRLIDDFEKNPFDTTFCRNDVIADWVVRELRSRGIRVPEDVAVIGYDNDPAYHGEGTINVATIDAPAGLMMKIAGEKLFKMIDENEVSKRLPQVTLETVFISGDTERKIPTKNLNLKMET